LKHQIRDKSNGGNGLRSVKLTPMKAIRYFCVECVGWNVSLISICSDTNCPLFPYKSGRNPQRAGTGGNPNIGEHAKLRAKRAT
jgi:hypothetical protein